LVAPRSAALLTVIISLRPPLKNFPPPRAVSLRQATADEEV
jgi:hypothetical protein